MLRRIFPQFVLIVIGLLLSGCASYTPEALNKDGWLPVDVSELRSLGEHTAYEVSGKFVVYDDGQGAVKLQTKSGFRDSGRKDFSGDGAVCYQWQKFRGGKKQCRVVWKKGGNYRFIWDDELKAESTIKPGNPEKM